MTHSSRGPTLVFLHGWLGDESEWQDVASRMANTDVHFWSLDAERDWQTTITRLVERLPEPTILVGYSLGARVALGCALHPRSRLAGLVLLSGNPGLGNEADRDARWQHDQALASRLREALLNEFLVDWYNQPIFAAVPESVKLSWIQQRTAIDREHQARLLECLSVSQQPDYMPQLSTIKIPTLVLAGALDDKYVSLARIIQVAVPGAQLKILLGVGHAAHREQPQQVADCLNEWVRSIVAFGGKSTIMKEGLA